MFAISMIPITIKHILANGGFSNAKNLALQAWHARRRNGLERVKTEDEGDEERLLPNGEADDDDELEALNRRTARARAAAADGGGDGDDGNDKLDLQATARLSLEFCMLWFVANYLASACLEYTSVASVTILSSTSSVWTLIACAVMQIERFSVRKLVGVLASLSGIVLISMVDLSGTDNDDDRGNFPHKSQGQIAIGDTMALVSAGIYGLYVVVMKRRVGNEDRVNMPLFFGLLGLFNIVLLWPLFFVLHWTGIEPVS